MMEASRRLTFDLPREGAAGVPRLGAQPAAGLLSKPLGQLLAVALLVLVLSAPLLFLARPAALTSDESLYLAEGLNIAQGKGFTYPWGDAVNHRGPLFPAVLAADLKLLGGSLGAAYLLPKLVALVNALLLFLLGRRLFSPAAGAVGAALAAGSSYLNGSATTLYLDSFQTMFLLVSVLWLFSGIEGGRALLCAASGAALGLAFLVKESALLWLPLPVLFVLLGPGRGVRDVRGVLSFLAGVVLVSGWWWAWVYAHTGRIYLVGGVDRTVLWLSLMVGAAMVVSLSVLARTPGRRSGGFDGRWAAFAPAGTFVALLTAWCALFLYGLERSAWPFPIRYLDTVPEYFATVVAASVRPFYVVMAAWGFLAYRAFFGHRGARLLLVGLALYAPFTTFTANRFLQLRDLMPVVYLSYLAVGVLAAEAASWTLRLAREPGAVGRAATTAVAGLAAVAGALFFFEWHSFVDANDAAPRNVATQGNWDNPLVRRAAAWMEENIPAGSRVLSTRLYYSHLYFLTGGRYSVRQFPTVRVEVRADAPQPLRRVSTLFRWEEHRLGAPRVQEDWVYLRRYPYKLYYIALSEKDLLGELEAREIDYVVLTTEDAGFSSVGYLDYLLSNPGFTLVHREEAGPLDRVYFFRVDRERLRPLHPVVTTDRATLSALVSEAEREGVPLKDFLGRVAPQGLRVRAPAHP